MIQVTERAARRIQKMLQEQGKQGHHLRVQVEGGGCAGMQYGLTFDEHVGEDDETIVCDGFQLVVDRMSLPLLEGSVVDFSDSLMDGGFKVRNPKAKTTCGCGMSFGA